MKSHGSKTLLAPCNVKSLIVVWITSHVHFDNSPDQCYSLHINYTGLKYSQSATYHAEYLHVQVLINYANKYRHTPMANTVLVSDCSSTALQPTLDTFPRQTTAFTSNTGATSTMAKAKVDSVPTLRNSFRQFNVSPEVTDILMASWRSGTQKQYKTYLEKWFLFCCEREVNYCSPPISDALEFLMGLYAQGLGYSTLNTARSAPSAILRISDCQNFGSHPLVVRFMKGVFETRKPKPKYDVIWDASKVLTHLSTLHPVKELPLKDLTLKLVMLLLLVTGQRGQSIHLMTLSAMKFTESECQFQILNSQAAQRQASQSLHLNKTPESAPWLLSMSIWIALKPSKW